MLLSDIIKKFIDSLTKTLRLIDKEIEESKIALHDQTNQAIQFCKISQEVQPGQIIQCHQVVKANETVRFASLLTSHLATIAKHSEDKCKHHIHECYASNSRNTYNNIIQYLLSGVCFKNLKKEIETAKKFPDLIALIGSNEVINENFEDDDSLNFGLVFELTTTFQYWISLIDKYLQCVCNKITVHHPELYIFQTYDISKKTGHLNTLSEELELIIKLIEIEFNLDVQHSKQIDFLSKLNAKFKSKQYFKTLDQNKNTAITHKITILLKKIDTCKNKSHKIIYNGKEDNHPIELFDDYLTDLNKPNIREGLLQSFKKSPNQTSFKRYYLESKQLKKDSEILNNSNKILSNFESSNNNYIDNFFNEWAFKISKNYFFNKHTKRKIEEKKYTTEEYKGILENIIQEQSKSEIEDFYPFFSLAKISLLVNENQPVNKIEDLEEYNIFLTELIERIEINLEWSKNHLHWAFQPSYEECCKKNESLDIFTPFAYVTPIDYNYFDKEINLIKRRSELLWFRKEMSKTKESISKETNISIENTIKSALGKNVEILSVFAAIVLFTIGNIQIFKEVSSINEAIVFMLTFAYVIAIFVLLIRQITKGDQNKNKTEISLIIILALITILCISWLIYTSPTKIFDTKHNDSKTKSSNSKQHQPPKI
jgi:hypothetical protein